MLEAKAKLEAGTPFNQVATEYSEDKARSGGNLGWMNRAGMMVRFDWDLPVSMGDGTLFGSCCHDLHLSGCIPGCLLHNTGQLVCQTRLARNQDEAWLPVSTCTRLGLLVSEATLTCNTLQSRDS